MLALMATPRTNRRVKAYNPRHFKTLLHVSREGLGEPQVHRLQYLESNRPTRRFCTFFISCHSIYFQECILEFYYTNNKVSERQMEEIFRTALCIITKDIEIT